MEIGPFPALSGIQRSVGVEYILSLEGLRPAEAIDGAHSGNSEKEQKSQRYGRYRFSQDP